MRNKIKCAKENNFNGGIIEESKIVAKSQRNCKNVKEKTREKHTNKKAVWKRQTYDSKRKREREEEKGQLLTCSAVTQQSEIRRGWFHSTPDCDRCIYQNKTPMNQAVIFGSLTPTEFHFQI
jgi:proteasome lid subunit RPN8/RPN11